MKSSAYVRLPRDDAVWVLSIVLVSEDDIFVLVHRQAVAVDHSGPWGWLQEIRHVLVPFG